MAKVVSALLYTKDHEWVQKLENGKVRVGITDFAQQALGDVVFVELPEEGSELSKEGTMGSVESVKSVTDVYAPLPGTVVSVNRLLENSPGKVNADPYGEGWIAEIALQDGSILDGLLTADEYEEYIKEDE